MDESKIRPDKGKKVAVELPTTSPFDPAPTILSREEWGAEEPGDVTTMSWLPTFVRIIHTDNERPCETREECIREVRALQRREKNQGMPDINFSFLVGEGGTIYEGRGWKTDVQLPEGFREVQGKTISIAYMGNYKYTVPPWEKMIAAYNLVIQGVTNNHISPFFDFQHLVFDSFL